MKRILLMFLALALIFGIVACSNLENTVSDTGANTIITKAETESTDNENKEIIENDAVDDNLNNIEISSDNIETSKLDASNKDNSISGKSTISNKHTHVFVAATCTTPKKCSCGEVKGVAIGHNYENGFCKICNAKDLNHVQYTVIYDSNGGWGETKSSSHIYNEARSLSKNGFKRAGYTFMGWSTTAHAKKAEYNNCQVIKNLTDIDDKIIILYAVWKESQTAKFDECQRAMTGKKEVNYHATIVDNMGNLHNDVAVFVNNDYSGEVRYDERYTKGLFSKIKGTLYLGGEFTVDNYTSLKIIIKADGIKVYESDFFTKYSGAKTFNVDITGANIVEIRVLDPESGYISHWNKGGDIIVENLTLIR